VTISIRAATRCGLAAALLCLAASFARAEPASVDAVYLALGQGEMARAAALSAALLDDVSERDARRGAALQASLDTLYIRGKLDGPDASALRDAIVRYSTHDARGHALAELFDVEQLLVTQKPKDAL